ncbi:hypothetical protein BDW74DRAFT_183880 [Aspergillus multicolor]|uniref:uncharacterized protein n=1 Tax=Aspergillus multicolor TaxID=41759 RepID=UPI003CCCE321
MAISNDVHELHQRLDEAAVRADRHFEALLSDSREHTTILADLLALRNSLYDPDAQKRSSRNAGQEWFSEHEALKPWREANGPSRVVKLTGPSLSEQLDVCEAARFYLRLSHTFDLDVGVAYFACNSPQQPWEEELTSSHVLSGIVQQILQERPRLMRSFAAIDPKALYLILDAVDESSETDREVVKALISAPPRLHILASTRLAQKMSDVLGNCVLVEIDEGRAVYTRLDRIIAKLGDNADILKHLGDNPMDIVKAANAILERRSGRSILANATIEIFAQAETHRIFNRFLYNPPSTDDEIVLAFGHQHHVLKASDLPYRIPITHPAHVMLTLVPEDSTNCTRIHVTNGPQEYEHLIEHNKDQLNTRAASSEVVGEVWESQLYVAALLDRLAEREFVTQETAQCFRAQIIPCVADQLRAPPLSKNADGVDFCTKHYASSYVPTGEADMLKDRCFNHQRIEREDDPFAGSLVDPITSNADARNVAIFIAAVAAAADEVDGDGDEDESDNESYDGEDGDDEDDVGCGNANAAPGGCEAQ